MSTKLPKPSGLKPPQIRLASKPLESKPLEFKPLESKPLEFKPVLSSIDNRPRFPLRLAPASRRRSKSVTDLTHINKNAIDFKSLRQQILAKKGHENKAAVLTSTLGKAVSKATVRAPPKTAIKRPAAATASSTTASKKCSEDGPSNGPKVSKWDFKGRYNLEVEKNLTLQGKVKGLTEKLSAYSNIDELYTKEKNQAAELAEAKRHLTEKCDTLVRQNEEFKAENCRLANIETECAIVTQRLELMTKENENYSKDVIRLTDSLKEVTESYEKLKEEHAILKKNHEQLVENHRRFTEKNHKLIEELETKKLKIDHLEEDNFHLKKGLQQYQNERRVLHNTIQDLKGNIRVFCRVRPPLFNEEEQNLLPCNIEFKDETTLDIKKTRESVSQITGKAVDFKTEFVFDRVFPPESTQEEIFEDLSQLVQSALDGYDVCVFAYGQTGSGKTYTMQGGHEQEKWGMIPRTIDQIFKAIEGLKLSGWEYTVEASFLEIYNENIRDLLNIKSSMKLEVCFNEGRGTTVSNLTIKPMSSAAELKENMILAHKNRATAATNFNEHSSRSHAVTKIYIQGQQEELGIKYCGSINLVDLAGSENAKCTNNDERLKETKNINKSLAALGNVMMALKSKSKQHIPYRDSKLTFLLQSSLGGNSKTLMVVNIPPFEQNYMESISSLRFASKVKEVKTVSKKNKTLLTKSNSMIN